MAWIYRREEVARAAAHQASPVPPARLSLARQGVFFALLLAILVLANWAPGEGQLWSAIHAAKWWATAAAGGGLLLVLVWWLDLPVWRAGVAVAAAAVAALVAPDQPQVPFGVAFAVLAWALAADEGELREWLESTFEFSKQILPLLLAGVLLAGLLLGRPGHEGLIPSGWVEQALGGNGPAAVAFAAVAGALMYFATLTEVPILQGLLGAGMGQGPALALLLAGPALSLPAMLVLRSLVGWQKTLVYVALVVLMATAGGVVFGRWCG